MGVSDEVAAIAGASRASGFRLIGHSYLNGFGDGMQVLRHGDHVYVAHLGTSPMALSIVDVADPTAPQVVRQIPSPTNTHAHKVQISGQIMLQNCELPYFKRPGLDVEGEQHRAGVQVYDLSDPTEPRPIAWFATGGKGVHRMWYHEGSPYAHITTHWAGYKHRFYMILDLSDPSRPREVGRWWMPGMKEGDTEAWAQYPGDHTYVHSVIPHGDRGYAACVDAGFVLLDISDLKQPRVISRIDWSPPFGGYVHTALPLPGRQLVVCACEAIKDQGADGDKRIWLVDVREERQPVTISTFPHPAGDFLSQPMRFGPHNVHENRPGSFQSENLIFATYYNAGLRAYDIRNPYRPEEIAHFLPPAPPGQAAIQLNDLYVDENRLVYVTDRYHGGLYILEYTGPVL